MRKKAPMSLAAGMASLRRIQAELEWLAKSLVESDLSNPEDAERLKRVNLCREAIDTLRDWPWATKFASFMRENKLPKSTYYYLVKSGLLPPLPMVKFGRTWYVLLAEAYHWLCAMQDVSLVVARVRPDNDDRARAS